MERKLLLLGLLRNQPMHGYQINELIDSHMGTSVQLTKPTAYRFLAQMAEDGWIEFQEEQEGNRPARRVYSITPRGEQEFHELLRKSLRDFKPAEFRSAISLAFLDALPREEALSLLRDRRSVIEEMLSLRDAPGEHHGGFNYVIEHTVRHLNTELEWLNEVIARFDTF